MRHIIIVNYQYYSGNHERSHDPRQRILIIDCKNEKPIKGFCLFFKNKTLKSSMTRCTFGKKYSGDILEVDKIREQ